MDKIKAIIFGVLIVGLTLCALLPYGNTAPPAGTTIQMRDRGYLNYSTRHRSHWNQGGTVDRVSLRNMTTLATNVKYTHATHNTVAKALDALFYQAPTVTLLGGSNKEFGEVVTSILLSWSTNKTLTTQSIDNGIGIVSPASTRTYNHTGQAIVSPRTYTITVSDGTQSATSTTTISFYWKRYWGVSSLATLNDAQIRALSSEFASDRSATKTLTASGQYLYFAWPSSWGVPTWTVNGLVNTDFTLVRHDSFTNASGGVNTYRVYRSGNLLTGTYTVGVY